MTTAGNASGPLRTPDRFFIGCGWAVPSSTTTLDVIDPSTEGVYLLVAAAQQNGVGARLGTGTHIRSAGSRNGERISRLLDDDDHVPRRATRHH